LSQFVVNISSFASNGTFFTIFIFKYSRPNSSNTTKQPRTSISFIYSLYAEVRLDTVSRFQLQNLFSLNKQVFGPVDERVTKQNSRKSSPVTPVSSLRHVRRQDEKVKMKKNIKNTINNTIKSSAIAIGIKAKKTIIFTEKEKNSELEHFEQIWVSSIMLEIY